jgi:ACS family pantothenate transporter-like MFS transporter
MRLPVHICRQCIYLASIPNYFSCPRPTLDLEVESSVYAEMNNESQTSSGKHIHHHGVEVDPLSDIQTDPSPSNTPRRSFRSFIWDTDTHLKTPQEQRLLLKLDIAILSIGCLGFFMKYLDQGNMANAYVSGMQEELNMYGNEYTYAGSVYTVAYAVMQIPSTLIIQRVRPSLWLAIMEVCWGVFTFAQAGMHSVGQLYAFRFLVGFFESSFFPSLLYVLGSWYTKTELAKRVALFHMTAPLGSAFGGYLQAAVYKTLDGSHGLAGWRWLYIICGVSLGSHPFMGVEHCLQS